MKKLYYILPLFYFIYAQVFPEIGLRSRPVNLTAFTNAIIHITPTEIIHNGSLIIEEGKIISVGSNIKIPSYAQIVDCTDKHIYPGFIDMLVPVKVDTAMLMLPTKHWNSRVHPEYYPFLSKNNKNSTNNTALRSIGFTSGVLTPKSGIFRGFGVPVIFDNTNSKLELDGVFPQNLAMEHGGWDDDEYPNSLLGSIALIRQTFYDSEWYQNAWNIFKKFPNLNTIPSINDALASLSTSKEINTPFFFHIKRENEIERVSKLTKEFKLNTWMLGTGYEYRNLNLFSKFKPFVILPINLPTKPNVTTLASELNIELRVLKHWDQAPYNPSRLISENIEFSITSYLSDAESFRDNLAKLVRYGLDKRSALAALTTIPAERLGLESVIGTLEKGKIGNLFIIEGDYFDPTSKIVSVWANGDEFEINTQPKIDIRGDWVLSNNEDTLRVEGENPHLLSASIVVDTTIIKLEDFTFSYPSVSYYYTDVNKNILRYSGNIYNQKITGKLTDIYGLNSSKIYNLKELYKVKDEEENIVDIAKELEVFYPEGAYGFTDIPSQHTGDILITNATLWTSSRKGILEGYDLLISNGIISKINNNIRAPKNAVTIDGAGKHITAGLIDAHSHTALSAVNEGSQAITSEVRIKDVINPYDIAIYRELAGGLTTANLLHGSANPIGGQNAVIKLKWGNSASEMIVDDAIEGIKFALGENVKQSNWGEDYTDRYPQTRMGVDQIIRDAFNAALEYRESHNSYIKKDKKKHIPPRKDLELEALLEIIEKDRLIHCHSYRQDEILNLIRIADDYGFTIGTLQHVLEGYKVAEAIKQHGAGASTFSDWWAYKFEVYDAIPYNGDIMHKVGVNVSFNSDSNDLARRMNLESAKAMRYGDMSPVEALNLVTINPARQLRIDNRVGSLEVGKDADFVIWSDNPLSAYTICEQTWIEGIRYFDLEKDMQLQKRDSKLRSELIAKALKSTDSTDDRGGNNNYNHKFKAHSCGLEIEDGRLNQ